MKTLTNLANGMTALQIELAILLLAAMVLMIVIGLINTIKWIAGKIRARRAKRRQAKRQNLFKGDSVKLDAIDAMYSFGILMAGFVAYYFFGNLL